MEDSPYIIDLRSDTFTSPTKEMRTAMKEAVVGDDVYGEDPTVNDLQELAAQMCKKEAALFVPSGTMGNLISILTHCWQRGGEIILGDQSHIYLNEQGGLAQVGGVHTNLVHNKADGTLCLEEIKDRVNGDDDPHHTQTMLIAVENTLNGKILPISFLKNLRKLADELHIPVHMDGARLMNAVVGLNVEPYEITKYVDSISICLSKGLGAPVGSLIVGSKVLINRARRLRKLLGGSMRQSGVLAAPGIIALSQMPKRLKEDHENAKMFANGISEFAPKYISINLKDVHTNMVWFDVLPNLPCQDGIFPAQELCKRMIAVSKSHAVSVKLMAFRPSSVRAVFYNGISKDDTARALEKFRSVMQSWLEEN